MLHYKGKGEHSVNELEQMCTQYQEKIGKLVNERSELFGIIRQFRQFIPWGQDLRLTVEQLLVKEDGD